MRIGIITGEYLPMQGGIATHCHLLAQQLTQAGNDIYIYSDNDARQQIRDIPVTGNRGNWGFQTMRDINTWANNLRLDVVDLHYQTAAYQMSPWIHFLPDFVEVPMITTFHDLLFPYLFPKAGRLRDWIVMRLARASEGVVVTNYEDYQRIKHLPDTCVIPIGSNIIIQPDMTMNVRAQYGLSSDDFVIAHFGFVNHSKGIDNLIEALAICGRPNFKLLMIGDKTGSSDPTNHAYAQKIDQLIIKHGLEAQVIWTGFLEDSQAIRCMIDADVIAMPFKDGASLRRSSLIVAIMWGCPIITTEPKDAIPDFDQSTLYLVERDQSSQLANALMRMSDEKRLRESLKIGVKKLHHYFDWADIVTEKQLFYRRIVEQVQR